MLRTVGVNLLGNDVTGAEVFWGTKAKTTTRGFSTDKEMALVV